MKKCTSCGAEFKKGKFCGKCGAPLEEKVQPVANQPEVVVDQEEAVLEDAPEKEKKVKKEKKEKPPKEKKEKGKKGKIIAISLAVLLLGVVGFTAYYLNQSQMDLKVSSRFDEEEFTEELFEEHFDGTVMEIELSEKGVNYYIQENLDKESLPSLPLGIELTEVLYKEGILYAQLDSGFIHTTLALEMTAEVEGNLLILSPEKTSLGKWNLPIPVGLFTGSIEIPIEVELPRFLTLEDLKLGDELSCEIILDEAYFDDLIMEASSQVNEEMLTYAQTINGLYYNIALQHSLVMAGDEEALKALRYELVKDEEDFIAFLSLLRAGEAKKFTETLIADSLYLEEDAFDQLLADVDLATQNLDEGFEAFKLDHLEGVGNNLLIGVDRYFEDNNLPKYALAIDGKSFVTLRGKFLTIEDILGYAPETVPVQYEYELYYANGYYVGIETSESYYVVNPFGEIAELNKIDFYNEIGYREGDNYPEGSFLSRGNPDRASIAAAVSDFINSDNSIFIRYLKADDKWAVLIASPGDYPQDVKQYILRKENNVWSVSLAGEEYTRLSYHVQGSLIESGFNPKLLPPYEVPDYDVWYYSIADMEQIHAHLVYLDKVTSKDDINYFSRIDDTLVVSFESGKRFFFLFDKDSKNTYQELITLETGDAYSEYYHRLLSAYDGPLPTFVFIQD